MCRGCVFKPDTFLVPRIGAQCFEAGKPLRHKRLDIVMDWVTDLEATCSNLGTWDGNRYVKDPDCSECLKDLIRFLRRDDENHEIRRRLGQIQVVQSDLIPLMRDFASDGELFELVLRLVVNLTNPELLLFKEELPEEKLTRNYYLQLQRIRQEYKRAFVDEPLWKQCQSTMGKLLEKDPGDRSEEDQFTLERILILLRNILQVPSDAASEQRQDDDVSLHDQILWVLHKSGMVDILLFLASAGEESQFCLHIVEIISLMLREQDPTHLASANVARSQEEKNRDERLLLEARAKEMEVEKQRHRSMIPTRHSRFGGTYVVSNMSSITDGRNHITYKPLKDIENLEFDKDKRPKKLARNKMAPPEKVQTRRSTLSVRLFLKEFCVEFLHGAYNALMRIVKDCLNRQRAQQNDESYYLWSMRFFMEFNRKFEFHVDFVSETLSKSTFHYIQQQIEVYKDNFEHEKRNRPVCLLWSRRMHLALRAYGELLNTIVAMENSKSEEIRHSAKILLANVFYEPEYREVCLTLFSVYRTDKMAKSFLRHLVETNHVFLKLLEHMAKSNSLVIGKRLKKRKTKRGKGAKGKPVGGDNLSGPAATNEKFWDDVSTGLTDILQGDGEDLPTGISPFDATLDLDEDKRKAIALYRIQLALKHKKAGLSLALLRASREVWPEGEVFGAEDIDAEEEFILLREILFSEIDAPGDAAHIPTEEQDTISEATQPPPFKGEDNEGSAGEKEEGMSSADDDEEDTVVETYIGEQSFDLKAFVLRYANSQICTSYAQLFREYGTNSDFTNHSVVKMFHRIAFDCNLPALLFHISIFRVFQKVHEEFGTNPNRSKSLKEIHRFAKYILGKFFILVAKSPKCFIEVCFWNTPRGSLDVMDGYEFDTLDTRSKSKMKSFWSEEDEETLTRTFEQLKDMEGKESNGDAGTILDGLAAFLEPRGKTRRQITRRLKELSLIQNTKEINGGKKKARKSATNHGDNQSRQSRQTYKSRDTIEESDSSEDDERVTKSADAPELGEQRPALFSDGLDSSDSSSAEDDPEPVESAPTAIEPSGAPEPAPSGNNLIVGSDHKTVEDPHKQGSEAGGSSPGKGKFTSFMEDSSDEEEEAVTLTQGADKAQKATKVSEDDDSRSGSEKPKSSKRILDDSSDDEDTASLNESIAKAPKAASSSEGDDDSRSELAEATTSKRVLEDSSDDEEVVSMNRSIGKAKKATVLSDDDESRSGPEGNTSSKRILEDSSDEDDVKAMAKPSQPKKRRKKVVRAMSSDEDES